MRTKTVLFLFAFLAVAALSWSSAQAGGFGVGLGIGIPIGVGIGVGLGPAYPPPCYYRPYPYYYPAPYYYPYRYCYPYPYGYYGYAAPARVYVQPAPVYVQPAPAPAYQQRYYPPSSTLPTGAAIPAPPAPGPPARSDAIAPVVGPAGDCPHAAISVHGRLGTVHFSAERTHFAGNRSAEKWTSPLHAVQGQGSASP